MHVNNDLLFSTDNSYRETVTNLLTILEIGQAHNGITNSFVFFGFKFINKFLERVRVNLTNYQDINATGFVSCELTCKYS
jgi:hypothetical protein